MLGAMALLMAPTRSGPVVEDQPNAREGWSDGASANPPYRAIWHHGPFALFIGVFADFLGAKLVPLALFGTFLAETPMNQPVCWAIYLAPFGPRAPKTLGGTCQDSLQKKVDETFGLVASSRHQTKGRVGMSGSNLSDRDVAEHEELLKQIQVYRKDHPTLTWQSAKKYTVDKSSYVAGEYGWLRRRMGTSLIGWSGQGKSVLVEQVGVQLACGQDLFGKIKVFQPVKVLYIECENGEDVTTRDLKSIVKHLKANEKLVQQNFKVEHNWRFQDDQFCPYLEVLLEEHKPVVVILDNLQGFCTGDQNKADVFNAFILPIMHLIKKHNAALILVDHAAKPPKEGNSKSSFDYGLGMYLGSGSARKPNWARTSCELINFSSDKRYRFNFSKSWSWADLRDVTGKPVNHFFIEQSGIVDEPYWKLADSQAPVIRGAQSVMSLEELEQRLKEYPDLTQAELAKAIGLSLRTLKRKMSELKAKKTGKAVLPKLKRK